VGGRRLQEGPRGPARPARGAQGRELRQGPARRDRGADHAPGLRRVGLLYVPARLDGPFAFEIKGSSYPTAESSAPQVTLGGDQHPDTGKVQTWRIQFGVPPANKKARKAKVPTTIVHFDGDAEETLSTKTSIPGKDGKSYKLVVKATKTKITAASGSRTLGSAKKDKDVYGYIGFRAEAWTEIKLTGIIDPHWMESKLEEVLLGQLEEFGKTYDASDYVPGWLSERLTEERRRGPKERDLIAELPDEFYDDYQEVYNEARADEFDAALARIDKMQAAGASEATCEYLRAQTRQSMTQLEPAVVHLGRCVELEPDFLEAALLRGSLLRELGRYDEALAAFEQAAARNATRPGTFEKAAQEMLFAGRPADAKRITQLAARNGVTSKALITLNGALAKAVHGPRWHKRFEHRSRNYHVMSDMDQMTCTQASRLLEEAFQAYREQFGWVEEDKTRLFKVYLFADRDGFMGYQADLEEFMGKPAETAAGLYTPLLKQLLIWKQPDPAYMLETIRHEGFHQYLDRLMPNPPVWFNEGLAVYHQNGIKVDGKLKFGQMHERYFPLLRSKGLIPLEKYLYMSAEKFYEGGHHCYAEGWLLVHMLQNTTPEYRAVFDAMVKALQTESSFVVVKRAFPPASLPKMDADLRAYLDKLDGS
jgi:tetratricopeptide (TPR) repeat protein